MTNRHFSALNGSNENLSPSASHLMAIRGFGRIHHIEIANAELEKALVAIDLIDADWLTQAARNEKLFSLESEEDRREAWNEYREKIRKGEQIENPFENAPIFRIEFEESRAQLNQNLSITLNDTEDFSELTREMESQWIELYISNSPNDGITGLLYVSFLAEPIRVFAKGEQLPQEKNDALSQLFTLEHLKKIDQTGLGSRISESTPAYLAAYDVGQGNSNALLDNDGLPWLYYDLGAGVYQNKKTRPANLHFCFSKKPCILLSHWDTDHWAGAYIPVASYTPSPLSLDWIAPNQIVTPHHLVFAFDIFANGGNLFIYPGASGSILKINASNFSYTLAVGNGPDRNSTGIVFAVEDYANSDVPQRSWLLTGDCSYSYFLPAIGIAPPVALIVPHHGAQLHGPTPPPPPHSGNYRRLIYSYGKNNKHGSAGVRHPTAGCVQAHIIQNWNHWAWVPANAGYPPPPGGDVRPTCLHTPGSFPGGVLIGWQGPPALIPPLCSGTICNAPLNKI